MMAFYSAETCRVSTHRRIYAFVGFFVRLRQCSLVLNLHFVEKETLGRIASVVGTAKVHWVPFLAARSRQGMKTTADCKT
jgi:hypothetical protein